MALKVPEQHQEALEKFLQYDATTLNSILETISTAPPALLSRDLSKRVVARVNLDADEAAQLVHLLSSLYRVREFLDRSLDDFSQDLCETLQKAKGAEFTPGGGSWETVKGYLTRILALDETLGVTAKALGILAENERQFCHARVITDLRPIFKPSLDDAPMAMLIVHQLKVAYHKEDREEHQQFFVALGSRDLRDLRNAIERAEKKEESLRVFAAQKGLVCLLEEHDDA